jgi:hypothetical protein
LGLEKEGDTNPFSPNPELSATVRTLTVATSTVAPFFLPDKKEFFMVPGQEASSSYSGLAILNNSFATATITVDVFSSAGTLLGTRNFVLGVQSVSAQFLRDHAAAAFGQDNLLIRVRSTAPMKILGFRGSTNLTDLLYLGGQ